MCKVTNIGKILTVLQGSVITQTVLDKLTV